MKQKITKIISEARRDFSFDTGVALSLSVIRSCLYVINRNGRPKIIIPKKLTWRTPNANEINSNNIS
jgi:hypothetical protein